MQRDERKIGTHIFYSIDSLQDIFESKISKIENYIDKKNIPTQTFYCECTEDCTYRVRCIDKKYVDLIRLKKR